MVLSNVAYLSASILFVLMIIYIIKHGALELKYSLLWLVLALFFIVISIFPNILLLGQIIFNIETPVNSLFLAIIGILLLIVFMLTMIVSRMSGKQRALAQYIACTDCMHKANKKSDVLVIIPAYNEEENILSVVEDIKHETDFDFIIINDCSADSTLSLCRANNIPVINLPVNLGIGGAVQTGYKYALRNKYKIAIQFDGDGQHKASFLQSLVSKIYSENVNLVIGSRFLTLNEGFKSTLIRRIGIRYFTVLIKLLTGKSITDPTSGMRACDEKLISIFANAYPTDYPEPESIVKILALGYNVAEIPVMMRPRLGGISSINKLRAVYYMCKVSLAIFIARLSLRK